MKIGLELLLPSGMSAMPLGDDVLLFQDDWRDHLIAAADDAGTRIADLKVAAFGFRVRVGRQAALRSDHLEITTPRKVC